MPSSVEMDLMVLEKKIFNYYNVFFAISLNILSL